jgi:hypothetical protein
VSANTRRIASVEKMSRNIAESMTVADMVAVMVSILATGATS